MASFYAELEVSGRTYPVRSCQFEFTQATGERGRVAAKVRHELVRLTLDVPDDDVLLDWAATPHKPLAGRVIFRSAQGGAALETLTWEDGQCVGYQEAFASGDVNAGAYVCHLTIAAPRLRMQPGGPAAYVRPAAREHGRPQQGLMNPFVVPLLTPAPVIPPLVVPVAEDLAAVAARLVLEGLAAAAAPVALVLALILASSTPAGGPGLPTVNRDEARLRYLVAQHAAGNLAPGEEAELIDLLAKVKGIYVQHLSELTSKPKHSPVPAKWKEKGGRIDILKNGNWQYADWDGNVVVYNGDEPNFDPHQRQQVDIEGMEGNCTSDFDKADKKAPLGPILDENTWHHKNNLKTMQEVPTSVHRRFSHYGARSIIKKGSATTPVKKSIIRKRKP